MLNIMPVSLQYLRSKKKKSVLNAKPVKRQKLKSAPYVTLSVKPSAPPAVSAVKQTTTPMRTTKLSLIQKNAHAADVAVHAKIVKMLDLTH